jgi:hypothetical protein
MPRRVRRRFRAGRPPLRLARPTVGVCHSTLHDFEVLLRNAVDARLGAGQPETPLQQTWLLDPRILSRQGRERVADAVDRLSSENMPLQRNRVVASLSFGFWKNLFIGSYEQLWISSLRHAFPGAALRRDVLKPLDRLALWRNRVAHHDSLLSQRSDLRLVDMAQVADFIDPDARRWLVGRSEILAVIKGRP